MSPSLRLLVVEDDTSIGEPLMEALTREGFAVTWVTTGTAALTAATVDLVLLDLGLPDLDGREVCRRLREQSATPVIVLTARDDEVERVLLFETGADDYVLKPFGFRELVARIRAVHRRSAGTAAPDPVRTAPPALRIDIPARRVWMDGAEIEFTPKEFDLLAMLAFNAGRACGREEIIDQVWDENWWGPTKTLDVHIASLRKKLANPAWITTLRGIGYRLDAPAEAELELVDQP